MTSLSTDPDHAQPSTKDASCCLFDDWFDPIELGIRERVRAFIEEMIGEELERVLGRPRYGRLAATMDEGEHATGVAGHRHGSRPRSLTGTFGTIEIDVPRARLVAADGGTTEWKSQALRA